MKTSHLKITQGGFVFVIRAENCCAGFLDELGKRWRFFVTDKAADVEVRLTGYDAGMGFTWSPSEKEPFARRFQKIRDRYPFDNGDGSGQYPPEELLSRLDPQQEDIRHIATRLSTDSGAMFASTDSGLFFFDPGEKRLYIFTRRPHPSSSLFSWLARRPSKRSAVFMADMTNGIMVAVAWLLVQEGGLLVHGTGLGQSGAAVLFLGLSGAGKSTVARRCPAEGCFSDDGVILKKTEGGIMVCPSVFMQAQGHWRRPLPPPMKLTNLFLLSKSDHDQVIPLDKNHLMNHILLHLIHFFRYFDNKTAKKAFQNSRDIVDALPAFRLDFTKTRVEWRDVWQAVGKRKSTNHRS